MATLTLQGKGFFHRDFELNTVHSSGMFGNDKMKQEEIPYFEWTYINSNNIIVKRFDVSCRIVQNMNVLTAFIVLEAKQKAMNTKSKILRKLQY